MLIHEMKQIIENLNNSFKRYYSESVLRALQMDFYKNNKYLFPDFNKVKNYHDAINQQYIENVKMLMLIENHYTERTKKKILPELRSQAIELAKLNFECWKKTCFSEVYNNDSN